MKYIVLIVCMLSVCFCSGCTANSTKPPTAAQDTKAATMNLPSGQIPSVQLNSGYSMPMLGLGTWTLRDEICENAVYTAIQCGYRLIDTARYYGNERAVGKGIQKAISEGIVKREEVFVTSKIMPGDYSRAERAIDESIADLGLAYIDLMLIHQPGENDENAYKALESGVRQGKIHSIGISNYYTPHDFERINQIAEITPAVVQNENHPYYQNTALQEYLRQYKTVIEAWYPLGGRGNIKKVLGNKTIDEIARRHGKTPAQIILRWQLQAGYVVIPGSLNPAHIAENANIFDFELTEAEMREMMNLNRQERFENW